MGNFVKSVIAVFCILNVFWYCQIKDGECDGVNELCLPVIYIGNTEHSWKDIRFLIERVNDKSQVQGWVNMLKAAQDDNNKYYLQCEQTQRGCWKDWGKGFIWKNIPKIRLAGLSTTLGHNCEKFDKENLCPQNVCVWIDDDICDIKSPKWCREYKSKEECLSYGSACEWIEELSYCAVANLNNEEYCNSKKKNECLLEDGCLWSEYSKKCIPAWCSDFNEVKDTNKRVQLCDKFSDKCKRVGRCVLNFQRSDWKGDYFKYVILYEYLNLFRQFYAKNPAEAQKYLNNFYCNFFGLDYFINKVYDFSIKVDVVGRQLGGAGGIAGYGSYYVVWSVYSSVDDLVYFPHELGHNAGLTHYWGTARASSFGIRDFGYAISRDLEGKCYGKAQDGFGECGKYGYVYKIDGKEREDVRERIISIARCSIRENKYYAPGNPYVRINVNTIDNCEKAKEGMRDKNCQQLLNFYKDFLNNRIRNLPPPQGGPLNPQELVFPLELLKRGEPMPTQGRVGPDKCFGFDDYENNLMGYGAGSTSGDFSSYQIYQCSQLSKGCYFYRKKVELLYNVLRNVQNWVYIAHQGDKCGMGPTCYYRQDKYSGSLGAIKKIKEIFHELATLAGLKDYKVPVFEEGGKITLGDPLKVNIEEKIKEVEKLIRESIFSCRASGRSWGSKLANPVQILKNAIERAEKEAEIQKRPKIYDNFER